MHCSLCGRGPAGLKFTIRQFEPAFDIYECPSCLFQFQNISEAEAYQFYHEDYYSGKAEYAYLDERKNEEASRIVWKARLKKLSRLDKTSGAGRRFLDAGCSFGGLMQTASEFGYTPDGVEISAYSGKFAQERFGQDHIFIGSIENILLPPETYSIVTMVEVIEHLYRPAAALDNIYQSMQPGGVLLVQTADMAGLQALEGKDKYHYYLPGHISYFTRANLEKLLLDTGFKSVRFIGGVEFGLLPKLRKSAGGFHKLADYRNWLRIAQYHYLSKLVIGGIHLTSSMVMLAWK